MQGQLNKVGVRFSPNSRMIPVAEIRPTRNGSDRAGVARTSPSQTAALIARSTGPVDDRYFFRANR